MAVVSDTQELMSRAQAAEFLGLREQTLACWATTGRYALPYVRVGRRARYRRTDLEKWLAERTRTCATDA